MKSNELAKNFLRFGLAFVFIYAAIEIYVHPENFLKYVPNGIVEKVPLDLFLLLFGIVEIALAIWLMSGWKGVYPALLSACMITGIVVCNCEYFHILFRNVAIAFGALALAVLELNRKNDRSFIKTLYKKVKGFPLAFRRKQSVFDKLRTYFRSRIIQS